MATLAGKAGIVTGGSSGIGFQIANVLAEQGATVYVISRTGKPKAGVGESAPGRSTSVVISATGPRWKPWWRSWPRGTAACWISCEQRGRQLQMPGRAVPHGPVR